MELSFTIEGARQDATVSQTPGRLALRGRAAAGGAPESLQWWALAARLAAVQALARQAAQARAPRGGGSFHPALAGRLLAGAGAAMARDLGECQSLGQRPVNPIAKASCKHDGANNQSLPVSLSPVTEV